MDQQQIGMAYGFPVVRARQGRGEGFRIFVLAPCCCFDEQHEGHGQCDSAPQALLEAEQRGEVVRHFADTWVWELTERGEDAAHMASLEQRLSRLERDAAASGDARAIEQLKEARSRLDRLKK